MTIFYDTTITAVGHDARALIEGGILILFADGAPPELAEISVAHRAVAAPAAQAPPVGARLRVGALSVRLTAIGETAWRKVAAMGHVVINFNGSSDTGRPGEMSAEAVGAPDLLAALVAGARITITD